MLAAYGWALARSSREAYVGHASKAAPELDGIDQHVDDADEALFDALERYLGAFSPPDLDWQLRRRVNNDRGVLLFSSSRNHRSRKVSAIEVLEWLGAHGPSSYGIVFLWDDEDARGEAYAGRYRIWRLLQGKVEELDDTLLPSIGPDQR